MRTAFAGRLLALWLLAGVSRHALAFTQQQAVNQDDFSGSTSISVAITTAAAGDEIIAADLTDGTAATAKLNGVACTALDSPNDGGSPASTLFTFSCPNAPSGSNAVVFASTGPSASQLILFDLSGVAATSPIDGHNAAFVNVVASGGALQPGSITPTGNGRDIFTFLAQDQEIAVTAPSGFTLHTNAVELWSSADAVQATAAAIDPSWTAGAEADNTYVAQVALVAPGSPPPPPPPPACAKGSLLLLGVGC